MPDFIFVHGLEEAMAINLRRELIRKISRPYCGENPAPGKDVDELDPTPGIRERHGSVRCTTALPQFIRDLAIPKVPEKCAQAMAFP